MGDYKPHVEYLLKIHDDPGTSARRQNMALWILSHGSRYFTLPMPPTRPEMIAAVMMAEAHLAAADLEVDLGEHLTNALWLVQEHEERAALIADGGRGDPWAPRIAEAMFQAGKTALEMIPEHVAPSEHARDADIALHKLKMSPCPTCGRAFGLTGYVGDHLDAVGEGVD